MGQEDRVIQCSGSNHYDIGYLHGARAKNRIMASIHNYEVLFQESVQINWSQAVTYANRFRPVLSQHVPHLLEEMQGIADGSCLALGDILALNARSEIALTKPYSEHGHSPPDGCTAFSVMTPNDEQYLSQNWDWKASQLDQIVVLNITTPTGLHLTTVTEAGIVAKVGMNSHGVGVTLNALKTVQMDPNKLPVHIALRLVLESTSVANALSQLDKAGVASAAHFLISDPHGSTGLEVNPVRHARILAGENRCIFHTNHCISPELPQELTEVPWLADSEPRLSRAERLCSTIKPEKLDFETIFDVFKDEQGAPNAINRDVDIAAHIDICTVFNIMMNTTKRTMRLSFGRPTNVLETMDLSIQAQ